MMFKTIRGLFASAMLALTMVGPNAHADEDKQKTLERHIQAAMRAGHRSPHHSHDGNAEHQNGGIHTTHLSLLTHEWKEVKIMLGLAHAQVMTPSNLVPEAAAILESPVVLQVFFPLSVLRFD